MEIYYFNENSCPGFEIGSYDTWLFTEINMFWIFIASAVLFLCVSKFLKKKPDSVLIQGEITEYNRTDLRRDIFINSELSYQAFAVFAVSISGNSVIPIRFSGDAMFTVTLVFLIITFSFQFFYCNFLVFFNGWHSVSWRT